jgi:hypothetical protein
MERLTHRKKWLRVEFLFFGKYDFFIFPVKNSPFREALDGRGLVFGSHHLRCCASDTPRAHASLEKDYF